MRKIVAMAVLAGALGVAGAASAQETVIVREPGTVGVATEAPVVGIPDELIGPFRSYVVEERVPNYVVPERVVVGAVLPDAGVAYYDVPERFGAPRLRYSMVNGRTVLVEPRTRRIIQVVD